VAVRHRVERSVQLTLLPVQPHHRSPEQTELRDTALGKRARQSCAGIPGPDLRFVVDNEAMPAQNLLHNPRGLFRHRGRNDHHNIIQVGKQLST
jgi:hypothetical protein